MVFLKRAIPVLALRGFVMFPGTTLHFDIGRKKSMMAVEKAMESDQMIFLTTQKDFRDESPQKNEIYSFGVVAKVKQILKQTGEGMRVLIEGMYRASAVFCEDENQCLSAVVKKEESFNGEDSIEMDAVVRELERCFADYINFMQQVPPELIFNIKLQSSSEEIVDYIASNILVDSSKKQKILEELDVFHRAEILLKLLEREDEILAYQNELISRVKFSMEKSQKEYMIREQIRILSDEIGEKSDPVSDSEKYLKKLEKFELPEETYLKLKDECESLSKMMSGTPDSNMLRNYLDVCVSLPWNNSSKDNMNLKKVSKTLNSEHFGLDEVKERLLEFLAVKKLSGDMAKGQIICLSGPPGVGKTSIVKSLADAMGRKYVRISLGGLNDESEIRGHRKTYIGSMPGRIIEALRRCKTNNPIILLDEIDKLSKDYHGDPASALLEALDPEQNFEFRDRYLEVPFDLSKVIFIATANDRNKIPLPLYDRMEIINLYSYTQEEKFHIAKEYLISKQLKRHGLTKKEFKITDEGIKFLIDFYTREAGVRELERKISSLMRKVAKKVVSGENCSSKFGPKEIKELLGLEKYKKFKEFENQVGVVKGLAWTAVGGDILPIETSLMKGKGKIQITGLLGNVMKESAQLAVSYIRTNAKRFGISEEFYKNYDIHIHAPEGAIPKDGPSAGVTMTTALISSLTRTPVKSDVAMTGEITLKGKVLPIGGLKEKTMAAYRDGVKTVVIPSKDESDLEKVDEVVKKSVKFVLADKIDDVLDVSFTKSIFSKKNSKTSSDAI